MSWLRVVDEQGNAVPDAPGWSLDGPEPGDQRRFREWVTRVCGGHPELGAHFDAERAAGGAALGFGAEPLSILRAVAARSLEVHDLNEAIEPELLDSLEAFVEVLEEITSWLEKHPGHEATLRFG